MRVPLAFGLESRDGSANKDERLTNMLAEQDEGVQLSVVRPGLATSASYATAAGNGLVPFNGNLVLIYGSTVYISTGSFSLPSGAFTPA